MTFPAWNPRRRRLLGMPMLAGLSGFGLRSPPCAAQAQAYDPLALPSPSAGAGPAPLDLTLHDARRNRDIPLRIYLPPADTDPGPGPAPVLLFSHGLGGSREGNPYLGRHWAARGYVVVFLQHAGSDEAVWKSVTPAHRLQALQAAANLRNTLLRLQDVPAVIDQLGRWQQDGPAGPAPLAGRLDLARLGMSGHSFGAVTTQAVSGQRLPSGASPFTDGRIRAALVLSPGPARAGADPGQVFGGVGIPWLLMTGTHDNAPVGDVDAASRLQVYPALPPGGKYELVLDGAEHDAFGDYPLRPGQRMRHPNHHRVILALSTAFWDAWLNGDGAARAWLDGPQPGALMEAGDRWQRK